MPEVLHARCNNVHESEPKRYLIQTRSQTRISGTILPKVHYVDEGVDSNMKPEKQIIESLVTVAPIELHVSNESKDQYHVKPRLGQGWAVIKNTMLRFPMPQPYDKPEQPMLLPERRPIIQIADRSILQPPKLLLNLKHYQKFHKKKSLVSRKISTTYRSSSLST